MRRRLGLGEDPEVTPIAEDHFLVRFEEEAVCARAIQEAPWVVGGQLLAMEPWRPAFVPARRSISKAVVWLRLPGLPMECWRPSLILAIAAAAGKPLALDSFTEKQRRKGFARVKVEIDSCLPVKPGVVVEAGGARFWQQFQFENLPAVCFRCGLVGHVESGCSGRAQVLEGGSGGEGLGAGPRMPRLGPWISTSRIRQPRALPSGGSRWAGPGPGTNPSSGPSSSSPVTNPRSSSSPPGSPSDSEGWQKPAKLARRVRVDVEEEGSGREGEVLRREGIPRVLSFAPLSVLGDPMEVGMVHGTPVDCRMTEQDQLLMKRPRSPIAGGKGRPLSDAASSKPASSDSSRSSVDLPILLGSSQGSSPGSISVSAPPYEGQVCPISNPCMVGVGHLVEVNAGDREGGLGEWGGAVDLVPVEVRLMSEVQKGRGVERLGSESGGRGVGGLGGEQGAGWVGGDNPGVGVGGQGKGKENLVLVGVREVDVLGLEDGGGAASVRAEGSPEVGGRIGRSRGSRGGGRGGRAQGAGDGVVGSARDRLAVAKPRVRSRSPGGVRRKEGVGQQGMGGEIEGGEGGSVGVGAQVGGHEQVVEGVRGAVWVGVEGSGAGTDNAGASGSC